VQQKCDELSHMKIGIGVCYVTEGIAQSIIIIIIMSLVTGLFFLVILLNQQ